MLEDMSGAWRRMRSVLVAFHTLVHAPLSLPLSDPYEAARGVRNPNLEAVIEALEGGGPAAQWPLCQHMWVPPTHPLPHTCPTHPTLSQAGCGAASCGAGQGRRHCVLHRCPGFPRPLAFLGCACLSP